MAAAGFGLYGGARQRGASPRAGDRRRSRDAVAPAPGERLGDAAAAGCRARGAALRRSRRDRHGRSSTPCSMSTSCSCALSTADPVPDSNAVAGRDRPDPVFCCRRRSRTCSSRTSRLARERGRSGRRRLLLLNLAVVGAIALGLAVALALAAVPVLRLAAGDAYAAAAPILRVSAFAMAGLAVLNSSSRSAWRWMTIVRSPPCASGSGLRRRGARGAGRGVLRGCRARGGHLDLDGVVPRARAPSTLDDGRGAMIRLWTDRGMRAQFIGAPSQARRR